MVNISEDFATDSSCMFPDRQTLISAQKEDGELRRIYEEAEQLKEQDDLSETSYILRNDVLYRLIRPVTASTDEEWKVREQILVPSKFRHFILQEAHESEWGGHLGIRKTLYKVKDNFWGPFIKKDVVRHCKSCHKCQMVGKPNQKITKAPLIPIPAVEEPFTQIVIDIVGPLPKTKTGFQYMLTIMDRTTRFPEIIPVRGIKSGIIIKHLMDFFSRYGLPREIQSDQGSNFTHREFQAKMNELGIKHNLASSCHPGKKLRSIWQWTQNNLSTSQAKMKTHYDRKSQVRNFEAGEQVLVLLPIPGQFRAQANTVKSVSAVVPKEGNGQEVESKEYGWNGENSNILCNPDSLFKHLNAQEATDIKDLFREHPSIFKDTPGLVRSLQHDVVLKPNAQPIRQAPYRLNPQKAEGVRKEVSYMLENDLITPSSSPWSSLVVLVKNENGQDRLCFDYRKVNDLTVADNFPLPRIEDCIDKMGNAKYISKLDLLKGYWQVPLTENAREISAFITPEGLFERKVVPFGMRNGARTFQRMMWMITNGLKGCVVYLDNIVIFSDNWKDHVDRIRALFRAIADAALVVNLSKCEFGKAGVIYLGHHVGQGKVLPKEKNIEAVLAFPTPKTRKNVRQFVGLAGYYRRKLNEHQKKYSKIEKEALALVLALQHFKIYVTSSVDPIVVYPDHNPLKFLNKFRNKNRRLNNWSLMLQEYNLTTTLETMASDHKVHEILMVVAKLHLATVTKDLYGFVKVGCYVPCKGDFELTEWEPWSHCQREYTKGHQGRSDNEVNPCVSECIVGGSVCLSKGVCVCRAGLRARYADTPKYRLRACTPILNLTSLPQPLSEANYLPEYINFLMFALIDVGSAFLVFVVMSIYSLWKFTVHHALCFNTKRGGKKLVDDMNYIYEKHEQNADGSKTYWNVKSSAARLESTP
ncbi:uncharacterized protein [Palaemon carinicauda]|uniref:uncharacterized protein n=1 Tax=Palaemon carinicauda TaxID=392227 RepID=UPI0035B58444